MYAVIIRIGGYYYIVVAQIVYVVFNSERTDQQIEFFVFDHPPAAFLVRIDGLSAKAEHRLVICVAFVMVPLAESPSVMNMLLFSI